MEPHQSMALTKDFVLCVLFCCKKTGEEGNPKVLEEIGRLAMAGFSILV